MTRTLLIGIELPSGLAGQPWYVSPDTPEGRIAFQQTQALLDLVGAGYQTFDALPKVVPLMRGAWLQLMHLPARGGHMTWRMQVGSA